jgi:ParB family chromosome partitioning protein
VEKDADTRAIEGELSAALKMAVRIDHGAAADGGRVTITYKTLDQLDDLLRRLSGG